MRTMLRAALVVAACSSPVLAQGWIVPRPCGVEITPLPAPTPTPRPPIRDCGQRIVRTRSDVRVELVNRVLRYEVEERFTNEGGMIGEADYLFPLPAGAAFQELSLSIDGELVSGETMNAGEARRIYEDIVRRRRDPALVEWMGHGLLRTRIFPINPGEEKRVVVRFQSVAQREGDALRIDYFRGSSASSRGRESNANEAPDRGTANFTLAFRPTAELGNPYSPTHELETSERDGLRRVAVRGDAKDVTLLIPLRRGGGAGAAITMLPYAPGNEDGFALITLTPPAARRGEPTPRDITLVLDVSGSMQGRKMEQARAAGRQLLATLRPQDRFRLIDFSTDVRTFRDEFVSATEANLRAAQRYLDQLEAVGSTNLEGALNEAVRPAVTSGRLPIVLFVTDGDATIGERRGDRLAAIAAGREAIGNRPARRIFTFGLGSDVNVSLLEQLALDGRGTAQFVRPDESVERMVGVVASRLVDPVLTDVRVRVDGDDGVNVRLSKILLSQPADVFAGNDLVVLARYSGHGAARIVVEGSQRGTPVQWNSRVDFPDRERGNPFVARLWATQRVGFLSAEKRKANGAPTSEIDEEIRNLGERYGIPTEFTSYLVLEPGMDPRRTANGAMGRTAGMMPGAAPAPAVLTATAQRDRQFEVAKAASEQRAAKSLVAVDMAASVPADAKLALRKEQGRTFVLRDGIWTDVRYQPSMKTLSVKPYSKAYFDLLSQLPELRGVFAIGDKVVAVGKLTAISVNDSGVNELSAAELSRVVRDW
jgi:Ca-activated chloride channel family protein